MACIDSYGSHQYGLPGRHLHGALRYDLFSYLVRAYIVTGYKVMGYIVMAYIDSYGIVMAVRDFTCTEHSGKKFAFRTGRWQLHRP